MRRLIIDVDIGPLDIGQALDLHLQLLGHVMGESETFLLGHHDVDLDDQPRTRMPCPDRVYGQYSWVVGHGDVGDELLHLGVGGDADQELEFRVRSSEPEESDQARQDDGAHGIDPPAELAAADRGEDTEAVDEEIVPVVFPEDADLAVLVPQGPCVEEEAELRAEGDADGDHGGEVEVRRIFRAPSGEISNGEGDQDERNGGHEEAEDDVASGLDARFTCGVLARIDSRDGFVAQDECKVRHWVEDCVGHCCEEGERAGGDGAVYLEDGEDDVGNEGAIDGDLEFELVCIVDFSRLADMFVDGAEEALDLTVLGFVETGQFAGWYFASEDERIVSITLARGVGSDEVQF